MPRWGRVWEKASVKREKRVLMGQENIRGGTIVSTSGRQEEFASHQQQGQGGMMSAIGNSYLFSLSSSHLIRAIICTLTI